MNSNPTSSPDRPGQPKAKSITFRPQHLFFIHMRLPAATTRASHLRERMQAAGTDGGRADTLPGGIPPFQHLSGRAGGRYPLERLGDPPVLCEVFHELSIRCAAPRARASFQRIPPSGSPKSDHLTQRRNPLATPYIRPAHRPSIGVRFPQLN